MTVEDRGVIFLRDMQGLDFVKLYAGYHFDTKNIMRWLPNIDRWPSPLTGRFHQIFGNVERRIFHENFS